ncbi:hypothetical protein [Caldicoprobacter algeriensis]|uniref:hypothetical protein n=1 Tax=Caldicoprobacter algeriensis TaxID=699281 RepID=UPI00207938FC|nr:hypothetical protein [Caldicoprobacter algeriensis]
MVIHHTKQQPCRIRAPGPPQIPAVRKKIEAFNNALSSLHGLNEKIDSIQQALQKLETLDDIVRLLNDISQKGVLSLSPSNSTVVQPHNNQQIDPLMEKLQRGIDQILSMGR